MCDDPNDTDIDSDEAIEKMAKDIDRSVRTALYALGLIDKEMYNTDYSAWMAADMKRRRDREKEDNDEAQTR